MCPSDLLIESVLIHFIIESSGFFWSFRYPRVSSKGYNRVINWTLTTSALWDLPPIYSTKKAMTRLDDKDGQKT